MYIFYKNDIDCAKYVTPLNKIIIQEIMGKSCFLKQHDVFLYNKFAEISTF